MTAYLPELLARGLALHRQGQLAKAQSIYDQILRKHPGHFDALHLSGVIAGQTKESGRAVEFFRKAIAANPRSAGAYSNLGNALKDLGQFDEAIAACNDAIRLKPDLADAYFNCSIALHRLRRFQEAITHLNRVISLKPVHCEAYTNRAAAFTQLRQFDDALADLDRAIALRPDYADAYANRGIALKELRRLDAAVASYDKAIAIRPGFAEAYYNRGNALKELARPGQAKTSYQKALELKPDYPLPQWALAFVTIPLICSGIDDISISRAEFAAALEVLDKRTASQELGGAVEAVGSSQPFYLAYQERDNKALLSRYGGICHRLMSGWLPNNDSGPLLQPTPDRIRIGIVSDHIRRHSVWNAIVRGLILDLDPEKFELHIYCLDAARDQETELAQSKAATFTQGDYSLHEWASAIRDKCVEVLLYPEIAMHPMTTRLASLRLAPLQLASWGHPETTGLPTIDYFVSADCLEPADAEHHYSEKLLRLPHLGCNYTPERMPAAKPDLDEVVLNPDAPVLLCPGTPFKYSPEHDWILIEIARQLGRCRLIFFTHQNRWLSLALEERLRMGFKEAGLDFGDFGVFVPWQKQQEFHGLMRSADVFLDTIGFSGFNTAMQAIECHLPIVTREGRFMRGRFASGILRRMGMPELVAATDEDYIAMAVKLARDRNHREQVRQGIRERQHILFNDSEPARALEAFLIEKCRHAAGSA